MKADLEQTLKIADDLFGKKLVFDAYCQRIAEFFYLERSNFLHEFTIGQDLHENAMTSYPYLLRRDLGNSISSMLRTGNWFDMKINETPDLAGQTWLQFGTRRLRDLMNTRASGFTKATHQGDHDFVTFGQCAISVQPNKGKTGLLYQNWHLKNMAWFDDETGQVSGRYRKWNPAAHELMKLFPQNNRNKQNGVHHKVIEKAHKTPFEQINCVHIVIPSDWWDEEASRGLPYVSLFIDKDNKHIMEEVYLNHPVYVVPRFHPVSDSQYAYSPATVIAMPDNRTLQIMTQTLLEAGERYTRPPLIATEKAINSNIDLSADGITWVTEKYDERLGAALRPIPQDRGGFPIGLELRDDVKGIMADSFYLNKLTLPDTRDMTATEVRQRMQEFRRHALPLFSPIEEEYNGQICEISFQIAFDNGFLGSKFEVPESLQGQEVKFKFESPLNDADDMELASSLRETLVLVSEAAALAPQTIDNIDFDIATRDAVLGLGAPAYWLKDQERMFAERQASAQQQQMAEIAEMALNA